MIIDGYTAKLQEQLIQRRTILIEEDHENYKTNKTLQRPLACRNAHCGAMCSSVEAEFCGGNPSRCFNYERRDDLYRNNEILDKVKRAREEMNSLPKDYEYALGVNACLKILDKLIESEEK